MRTTRHPAPSRSAADVPAAPGRPRGARALLHARPVLLIAFAFAVMADPVSSVAYAIEAALRALRGDLGLLLPTMGLVAGLIALIIVNYHQLWPVTRRAAGPRPQPGTPSARQRPSCRSAR